MKPWVTCLILVILATTLSARHGSSASPRPTPSPSQDPRLADTFRSLLDSEVDSALMQVGARAQMNILEGERPQDQLVSRGPGGLAAVTWAHESPEGRRWPVLIMKVHPTASTPPPDQPPLVIEAYSNALLAHRVVGMSWASDGAYLAILTQALSLDEPGGELGMLLLADGRIRLIDRDVTRFVMSPNGQHIVYERAQKPGDLTGPRILVHTDGATGQRRIVHEHPYPRVQVSSLGPFDAEGRVPLVLKDYQKGLMKPVELSGALDLAAGKFIRR